jgi:predicted aconitase with swiveling domain
VFNTAKGGVASAWMLREMMERRVTPIALVFNRVNPILAQGAAFGDLTLVDRFEAGDISTLLRTGDELAVEPGLGTVTILNREA